MWKPVLVLLALVCLNVRGQTPYLVKDINTITNAAPGSSAPSNFFRYGSRVFFAATTPSSGVELWSTDGTEAGTAQVADIHRGTPSSNPSRFVIVNGNLLFNATDFRGEELWTTDGTAAGTRLLADIFSGSRSSSPGDRIVYHGQMIFAADDGVDGRELWISDGTAAGTRFLKDLLPGASGSNPRSFVLFKDTVYFATDDALWKTDGTDSGTVKVKGSVRATNLTVTSFGLFFTGYTQATGSEPWVSDGTEGGTHMIVEITPGENGSTDSSFAAAFGDRVLFVAGETQHGPELWISDGTAAGTHIVRDVNPGAEGSIGGNPFITVVGNLAFFSARSAANGQELWKTDGTEAGTALVRDIVPGSGSSNPSVSSRWEPGFFSLPRPAKGQRFGLPMAQRQERCRSGIRPRSSGRSAPSHCRACLSSRTSTASSTSALQTC